MTSTILGFLPSRDGFAFANRWPSGPALEWLAGYLRVGLGDVGDGLCGGMCHVAADRFLRGEALESGPEPPAPGSGLFREVVRRQVDSFALGLVPFRFWWAATRVRSGRWSARDQVGEWRAIQRDVDGGRPAMLGLVRSATASPFALTLNHQVFGYGYEATADRATVMIYDPNHPGRDDVVIEMRRRADVGQGPGGIVMTQSTGEPVLALLRLPYRPAPAP